MVDWSSRATALSCRLVAPSGHSTGTRADVLLMDRAATILLGRRAELECTAGQIDRSIWREDELPTAICFPEGELSLKRRAVALEITVTISDLALKGRHSSDSRRRHHLTCLGQDFILFLDAAIAVEPRGPCDL